MNEIREILALGPAGTNGQVAAFAFAKHYQWKNGQFFVTLCDSHREIIKRLRESEVFAVLPINNSTCGEIMGVTRVCKKLLKNNPNIGQIDKITLQISHNLLVHPSIKSVKEITLISTKREAYDQCRGNIKKHAHLKKLRFLASKSTALAARRTATCIESRTIAAIGSLKIAKKYGLKVLEEQIQDCPRNSTTFGVFYHDPYVEPLNIAVFGGKGKFGLAFIRRFKELGCKTESISEDTHPSKIWRIIRRSDVVVFCTPTKETPGLISKISKHLKEDQLVFDITSVKAPAMEAMLATKAQVIGFHPTFPPSARSWKGRAIAVCNGRLNGKKAWVEEFLLSTGAKAVWINAERHDEIMGEIQGKEHFYNLIECLSLKESGIPIGEYMKLATGFYNISLCKYGRMLKNRAVYPGIMTENIYALRSIDRSLEIATRVRNCIADCIKSGDNAPLGNFFDEAAKYVGPRYIKESNNLFDELIALMEERNPERVAIVSFNRSTDRRGLLNEISSIFKEMEVNMASFHFRHHGMRRQFLIGFGLPKKHPLVESALKKVSKIEGVSVSFKL